MKGGKYHEQTYFIIFKMCSRICLSRNDGKCEFSLHMLFTPAGSSGRSYEIEKMVKQISRKLAGCFADNGVVERKDTGIYEYGLSIILYFLINLTIIFMIGGALGCIPESICYTLCYIILRRFTGGYHARTPVACCLFSTLMFFASITVVRAGLVNLYLIAAVAILAIVCSCIIPVDTENKKLSSKEKKVYRFISLIVFLLEVLLGVAAYKLQFQMLVDSIVLALFCCELLAIVGYLYNRWSDRKRTDSEQPVLINGKN